MMTLIIGGSGSGKSAFAEDYIIKESEGRKRYYLATMQVFDEEGKKKIERHRRLRNGKGFCTIEQPRDLEQTAEKLQGNESAVLLECMSNLVANEMFTQDAVVCEEKAAEKIIRAVELLQGRIRHFVIVSNNVFEDGQEYTAETMAYIRAIAKVNIRLAEMADEVIEVAAGIPVVLKSGR